MAEAVLFEALPALVALFLRPGSFMETPWFLPVPVELGIPVVALRGMGRTSFLAVSRPEVALTSPLIERPFLPVLGF